MAADGRVHGGLAGNQDDFGFGPPGFGLLQYFHAIEPGQHHIQKDQVKIAQVQVPEKILPRTIGLDAVAVFFQGRLEPFLDDDFVIHNGNVHGADSGPSPSGFLWRGSVTVKVAPAPTRLLTSIWPPCFSTMP